MMTILVTNSDDDDHILQAFIQILFEYEYVRHDDYANCANIMTMMMNMAGLPLFVWEPLEKCASPSSPSTRLESAFTFCVSCQMDLSHVLLFIIHNHEWDLCSCACDMGR